MAEYWEVIYKAIADFGDVLSEAAKAKAALEDVGKAAKAEGAMETTAATAAAAAHKRDTEAINEEKRALLELAAAAKLANIQSLYGGRSSMEQHLSDEQSEINLLSLLNRQKWLGFTTPQQAYAWRQQEYNQRLLMNRAEWAGYTTPDQYLQYLVKYRTNLDALNAVMRGRLALFQETAVAASNLGQSIGEAGGQNIQLGTQIAGLQQFNDAVNAIPDSQVTSVTLDDSAAIAEVARWDAIVRGIPEHKVTKLEVIMSAVGMGGVPLGGAVPIVGRVPPPETAPAPVLGMGGGAGGGGGGPPPSAPPAPPPDEGGGGGGGGVPGDVADLAAEIAAEKELDEVAKKLIIDHLQLADADKQVAAAVLTDKEAYRQYILSLDDTKKKAQETYVYTNLFGESLKKTGDTADETTGKTKKLLGALDLMAVPLMGATKGWFGLGTQMTLWGGILPGIMGHATAIHFILDAIIEAVAILVPALSVLVAGLAAFGLAGMDAARSVYNRFTALQTVANATGLSIAPLTGQLEKLHEQVRPMVWELYGDAIDVAATKNGLFNKLAIDTGHAIDTIAARITVLLTGGLPGLSKFIDIGEKNLAALGHAFYLLGDALMNLIKVTQETHVDQIFLAIFVALAKVLDLITKLPTPILALVIGLHAFWLWGGLLATVLVNLLGPLRAFMILITGLKAESLFGALPADASKFARLGAVFGDIGQAAAKMAGFIGLGGIATKLFGAEAATLLGIPVAGWAIGAALALAGVGYWLANLPDRTQKWIASLNKAVDAASIFDKINVTAKALVTTTQELAFSQATGTGNATELAKAQDELNQKLGLELTRVGTVSHAYGVDMVGALQLMNTAGVKANDLFTKSGLVWDADLQKIKGLVDGYKAMGQGLDQLQGDINAQLVTNQETLQQMDKINQAWDKWTTLVIGGQTTMVGSLQVWQSLTQELGKAGTSLDGLNAQSLTARNTYNQLIPNVGKYLDAVRNQNAALQDGQQGVKDLTRVTKDWVVILAQSAGGSKQAQDAVLAIAQQADPAINTWQKLTQWIGNQGVAGAEQDLNRETTKLETPLSNLQLDAQKLTTSLQADLTPAMVHAKEGAYNVLPAFNAFADSVVKLGPNSSDTISKAHQVAQILLAISPNARDAHDQFVAFAETMKYTGPQAEALWKQVSGLGTGLKNLPDKKRIALEIEAQDYQAKIRVIQSQLKGATGTKKLHLEAELKAAQNGLDGIVKQIGSIPSKKHVMLEIAAEHYQTKIKEIENQLKGATGTKKLHLEAELKVAQQGLDGICKQLGEQGIAGQIVNLGKPGLWGQFEHGAMAAGDSVAKGFMTHVADPMAHFFTGPFVGFFTNVIPQAWDKVWGYLGKSFDGWWKTHGDEVKQVWHAIEDVINAVFGWFEHRSGEAFHVLTGFFVPVWHIIHDVAVAAFKQIWDGFVAAFKVAFDVMALAFKIAWDVIVGIVSVILDLITGHWGRAWDDIKRLGEQVFNAFKDFVIQVFHVLEGFVVQSWHAWYGFLDKIFVQPFAKFFTQTLPHLVGAIGGFFAKAWTDVWHWFDKTIIGGLVNFFTKTIPNWLWGSSLTTDFQKAWDVVWNWFYKTIIGNLINFFTKLIPGWLKELGQDYINAWIFIWHMFDQHVIQPFVGFFTHTIPGWLTGLGNNFLNIWKTVWNDFNTHILTPFGNWCTKTVPNAVQGAFKTAINWVIDNTINKVINFLNNDVLGHLPGHLKVGTVGHVAAGGDVSEAPAAFVGYVGNHAGGGYVRMAGAGSVPGVSAIDGFPIMAMGGEYMLRQPARMAIDQNLGPNFLNRLNQADTWLGSGSRGTLGSQRMPGFAVGGLVNPIGPGAQPARVDMGVDYLGAFPLYALGSGRITTADKAWSGVGQGTFIGLQLNPPYGSGYWYYAEDINPLVNANQGVTAGQHIANATGSNLAPGIEVGWAAPPGMGQTMAAAQGQAAKGGDPGAHATAWGKAASDLIHSLGGPAGIISGQIVGGTSGLSFISQIWQHVEGLLNAAGDALSGNVKPLAGYISGGAKELLNLAKKGAKAIIDGIWDHTIKPIVGLVPSDTLPGVILQGGAAKMKDAIDSFFSSQDTNAQQQAASSGGSGVINPVSGPADAGPGQAEHYAQTQLSAHGWGPSEFAPLQQLWQGESNWSRFARNPGSGAYGIPQSLPESKLPPAGQSSGGSHASPQIDWGLNYIKSTPGYGSPSATYAKWLSRSPHWYVSGGPVMQAIVAATKNTQVREAMALGSYLASGWNSGYFNTGISPHEYGAWAMPSSKARSAHDWQNIHKAIGWMLPRFETGVSKVVGPRKWARDPRAAAVSTADWAQTRSFPKLKGTGAIDNAWVQVLHALGIKPAKIDTPGPSSKPGPPPPAWKPTPGQGKYPPGGYDAEDAWQLYSTQLLPQAVGAEMNAFWALMGGKLPKGTKLSDWASWYADTLILEEQQQKAIGMGTTPAGAYMLLQEYFGRPEAISPYWWVNFAKQLNTLVSWQGGPGVPGGHDPPSSAWHYETKGKWPKGFKPGHIRPRGYWGWKDLHTQWQNTRNKLVDLKKKAGIASSAWKDLYAGAGMAGGILGPGTPAPQPAPPPIPGLEAIATLGGPGEPVIGLPPDAGYGFAAGGPVYDYASMFALGGPVPYMPSSAMSFSFSGTPSGSEYPRALSPAGAAGRGIGFNVETMTINNPVAEQPSQSIARASNRLAFLAGRGMA